MARPFVHELPDGRRLIRLGASPRRLALAAGAAAVGLVLGLALLLLGPAVVPLWLGPLAMMAMLLGMALAIWPQAPVTIDTANRRLRLPSGRQLDFERITAIVLFTAARQPSAEWPGAHAYESRSVYLLTDAPARKRSTLRREIARWGAVRPGFSAHAVEIEAEAAAYRNDDLATLDRLVRGRERLVAASLSGPAAWTLARQLAFAVDVPLMHHAGHLAVLSPAELRRPLVERLRAAGDAPRPGKPALMSAAATATATAAVAVEVAGDTLRATWREPRLAQPHATAWLLAGGTAVALAGLLAAGLAEQALAALVAGPEGLAGAGLLGTTLAAGVGGLGAWFGVRRRTWELTLDAQAVTGWHGASHQVAMSWPTAALTDLFVVDHRRSGGVGLAVATADDFVLLPMAPEQASAVRQRLRGHLARLAHASQPAAVPPSSSSASASASSSSAAASADASVSAVGGVSAVR